MSGYPPGVYAGPVERDAACYCCGRRQRRVVRVDGELLVAGLQLVPFSPDGARPFPICADREGCDRHRANGDRIAELVRGVLAAGRAS